MFKIAIRQDNKANVIRAYYATLDESERFEVATLSLTLAKDVDELFDKWKAMLQDGLAWFVRQSGSEVTGWTDYRPGDKN